MNAVGIEEAVSKLAEALFDPENFAFAFLEAFGKKETTLKRLRSGNSNQSDTPGAILQSTRSFHGIEIRHFSCEAALTRCVEDILLAREAHFPTFADLYELDNMPADLRSAHERNDETLERIYIGRRFKNDAERLEKLFELYTKTTSANAGFAAGGKPKTTNA